MKNKKYEIKVDELVRLLQQKIKDYSESDMDALEEIAVSILDGARPSRLVTEFDHVKDTVIISHTPESDVYDLFDEEDWRLYDILITEDTEPIIS
jgi:hypothetical protein